MCSTIIKCDSCFFNNIVLDKCEFYDIKTITTAEDLCFSDCYLAYICKLNIK